MEKGELRERFLRFLASLPGSEIDVQLYERATVSGNLVAVKGDASHLIVNKLKTRIGEHENAVLRTSDTIHVSCAVKEPSVI